MRHRLEPMAVPADCPELAALVAEYGLRLHRVNSPDGLYSIGCTCGGVRYFATGCSRADAAGTLREYLASGESVAVARAAGALRRAKSAALAAAAKARARPSRPQA